MMIEFVNAKRCLALIYGSLRLLLVKVCQRGITYINAMVQCASVASKLTRLPNSQSLLDSS